MKHRRNTDRSDGDYYSLCLPASSPFLPPSLGKTYRLFPLLVFRVPEVAEKRRRRKSPTSADFVSTNCQKFDSKMVFSQRYFTLCLPSSSPFLPPSLGKTYRLLPLLVFRAWRINKTERSVTRLTATNFRLHLHSASPQEKRKCGRRRVYIVVVPCFR